MFSVIKEQHKGVDVCINNAGLAHSEPLLSGTTSGWKNMLDVREFSCLYPRDNQSDCVFVLSVFSETTQRFGLPNEIAFRELSDLYS